MKIPQIRLNTRIVPIKKNITDNVINKLQNLLNKQKLNSDIVEISEEMSQFSERLQALEESKTLKKLFTDEFKISQGMNKDGFYVTSIIDNKTGKPLQVYVKAIYTYENNELWGIFIKNIRGNYEPIGERSFEIDEGLKRITPGDMTSQSGNYKYNGIGIRLHQIAIERMMQKGLKNVQICSTENAFPFHYKCGFRVISFERTMEKIEFEKMLEEYSNVSGIDKKILYKNAEIIEDNEDIVKYSTTTMENWRKLLYAKGKCLDSYCDYPMKLSQKALQNWEQLIKSQPILEH